MTDNNPDNLSRYELLRMTTQVVAAYVGNNPVPEAQISDVIQSVYGSLEGLGGDTNGQTKQKPAVPIKRSITPDHIICLEDGKKLKMLKRYLRTAYGMSPEEYRTKWGLPADYPMVAPNYAKQRSAFAKQIGLGKRKR
ncbi:MAG: transcriptional regulator [Alphaproteobacteria bacterium]|nr:transcriptional regulator [Alphaproteobacteria bacterium]